jgi:glycerophosphoryl diester phosphodiesterase
MTRGPPAGVDPDAWRRLTARPIAHRGLWGADAPENSLRAFEAAAAAGYAVELDVQLSADGVVVVFHDDRMERLTAAHGRVAERTAAQLAEARLGGTRETIPTLAEALECVARRTLVLIELKVLGGEEGPLEQAVTEVLALYGGPIGVISFNPKAVAWFADHRPELLRGLNSTAYRDAAHWPLSPEQRRGLLELEHAHVARPHFVSLGADMLPSHSADAMRADGIPVICWTIRSEGQWARLKPHCDGYMFDGFHA